MACLPLLVPHGLRANLVIEQVYVIHDRGRRTRGADGVQLSCQQTVSVEIRLDDHIIKCSKPTNV